MHDGWLDIAADYNRAFELYTRAANKGHNEALCNLANMYGTGRGVTQDYSRAAELYELAAAKVKASQAAMLLDNAEYYRKQVMKVSATSDDLGRI